MTTSNLKRIETLPPKVLLIPDGSIWEPDPLELASLPDDWARDPLSRRDVLRRLAAGGGVAAAFALLPVQRAQAAFPWAAVLVPIATTLINSLFDRPTAQPLVNAVRRTPVVRRPSPQTFHEEFGLQGRDDDGDPVPLMWRGSPVPVTQTRYGSYFGLSQLPRYDRTSRVRPIKDLNEYEMKRISHPAEIEANGCVLFPCGERREPAREHEEQFAKTCELHGADPKKLDWLYTRPFNDGSKEEGSNTHAAFGVASKRDPTKKDLLISLA